MLAKLIDLFHPGCRVYEVDSNEIPLMLRRIAEEEEASRIAAMTGPRAISPCINAGTNINGVEGGLWVR
jgi:hypothetical protein